MNKKIHLINENVEKILTKNDYFITYPERIVLYDYIKSLEQENEDLKITKAGQHATLEILQERIDKAIETLKEYKNDMEGITPIRETLNILTGGDEK